MVRRACAGSARAPIVRRMGKPERHAAIQTLIREKRVISQEHLRELLFTKGFDVTQATLSRDIRELRLVKVPDADGHRPLHAAA